MGDTTVASETVSRLLAATPFGKRRYALCRKTMCVLTIKKEGTEKSQVELMAGQSAEWDRSLLCKTNIPNILNHLESRGGEWYNRAKTGPVQLAAEFIRGTWRAHIMKGLIGGPGERGLIHYERPVAHFTHHFTIDEETWHANGILSGEMRQIERYHIAKSNKAPMVDVGGAGRLDVFGLGLPMGRDQRDTLLMVDGLVSAWEDQAQEMIMDIIDAGTRDETPKLKKRKTHH